jgi:hypothetical protein
MEIKIPEPPEGYVVLDTIVLVKCIDGDGNPKYLEHFPTKMPLMEKYGMCQSAVDSMREKIQGGAQPG